MGQGGVLLHGLGCTHLLWRLCVRDLLRLLGGLWALLRGLGRICRL